MVRLVGCTETTGGKPTVSVATLLVTEPTVSALVQAVERLRADPALRAHLVRNALRAAEMFDARRVAGLLRNHLERS